MSKLIHVKALILDRLDASAEVKQAVLEVINSVDAAIDEAGGFSDEDEIDLAIQKLDQALTGAAEAEEAEVEDIELGTHEDDEDDDPLKGLGENDANDESRKN